MIGQAIAFLVFVGVVGYVVGRFHGWHVAENEAAEKAEAKSDSEWRSRVQSAVYDTQWLRTRVETIEERLTAVEPKKRKRPTA